jgi:hypothetical protein
MLKKRVFGMMALVVGVMLVFAVIGCDNGTTSGNGSGDLSQAEKEAAKTATLEEYSNDPEGFADFVAGMNSLKGWNLPSNPNTWSASQWEQYYSFIVEQKNGNGNSNDGGGGNTGWPPNATLSNFGLSGLTAPAGATAITWYSEGPTDTGVYTASALAINFSGTTSHVATLDGWFGNNGWERRYFDEDYDGNYTKGTFIIGDGYGQPGSYECYLSYGANKGCSIVVTIYL